MRTAFFVSPTDVGGLMKTDETCNVSKGITVRSEVKPGYLEVTLGGEFNLEEIEHIGTQIFDFCHETNLEKVLVDARKITGRPTLVTKIELSDSMIAKQIEHIARGGRSLQVAHLVAPGMADAAGFAEILGANRGMKIFVTTSLPEALTWLGAEPVSTA